MKIQNNSMGTTQTGKRCYTVDDLMEILGVGRKAVYTLVHSGEFRVLKISGVGYRIPKEGFDSWMNKQ